MLKRDYSKELISEIAGLTDRVVVSFATESFIKRKKFRAKRDWIVNFIKENFNVEDDFMLGGERYISFGVRRQALGVGKEGKKMKKKGNVLREMFGKCNFKKSTEQMMREIDEDLYDD